MSTKKMKSLSEEQIDEIVIAQSEDDAAWEEPISVHRTIPATISLPPELATQVAFFAQLHKVSSTENWIRSIIQERIDFEKSVFAGPQQSLVAKSGV